MKPDRLDRISIAGRWKFDDHGRGRALELLDNAPAGDELICACDPGLAQESLPAAVYLDDMGKRRSQNLGALRNRRLGKGFGNAHAGLSLGVESGATPTSLATVVNA